MFLYLDSAPIHVSDLHSAYICLRGNCATYAEDVAVRKAARAELWMVIGPGQWVLVGAWKRRDLDPTDRRDQMDMTGDSLACILIGKGPACWRHSYDQRIAELVPGPEPPTGHPPGERAPLTVTEAEVEAYRVSTLQPDELALCDAVQAAVAEAGYVALTIE